jgi:aconitate hydratase
VILYVAGVLTVSGGTNAIVEYIGPGARTISATGKATITNMGAEIGATTSMFPADERMAVYLRATGRGDLVPLMEQYRHLLEPDPEVEADPEKHYDRVVRLDLSTLEPHVVGPHSPDRARPISALAAEVADAKNGFIDRISAALIGSCTNSSYEDMSRAADVAEQAKPRTASRRHSVHGDAGLRAGARDDRARRPDGFAQVRRRHRARERLRPLHRPVAALEGGRTDKPNTIVTSYNRNFPARNDGAADTMNFIGEPRDRHRARDRGPPVVQSAHRYADRRGRQAVQAERPRRAHRSAGADFDPGEAPTSRRPPTAASDLKIDPASERLQLMSRGPNGTARLYGDAPVLMKTKGKTTTDDISPGRAVAALPRPPRTLQRQPAARRDNAYNRRTRQDASTC